MKWYIKERINPQFDKPYYVKIGQVSKAAARKFIDGSLYGENNLREYETQDEYNDALAKLESEGFHIMEP